MEILNLWKCHLHQVLAKHERICPLWSSDGENVCALNAGCVKSFHPLMPNHPLLANLKLSETQSELKKKVCPQSWEEKKEWRVCEPFENILWHIILIPKNVIFNIPTRKNIFLKIILKPEYRWSSLQPQLFDSQIQMILTRGHCTTDLWPLKAFLTHNI